MYCAFILLLSSVIVYTSPEISTVTVPSVTFEIVPAVSLSYGVTQVPCLFLI